MSEDAKKRPAVTFPSGAFAWLDVWVRLADAIARGERDPYGAVATELRRSKSVVYRACDLLESAVVGRTGAKDDEDAPAPLPLHTKTRVGFELTEAGERLIPIGRRILRGWSELRAAAAAPSGPKRLAVAGPDYIFEAAVASVVADLSADEDLPELILRFASSDKGVLEILSDEVVDMAVCHHYRGSPPLKAHKNLEFVHLGPLEGADRVWLAMDAEEAATIGVLNTPDALNEAIKGRVILTARNRLRTRINTNLKTSHREAFITRKIAALHAIADGYTVAVTFLATLWHESPRPIHGITFIDVSRCLPLKPTAYSLYTRRDEVPNPWIDKVLTKLQRGSAADCLARVLIALGEGMDASIESVQPALRRVQEALAITADSTSLLAAADDDEPLGTLIAFEDDAMLIEVSSVDDGTRVLLRVQDDEGRWPRFDGPGAEDATTAAGEAQLVLTAEQLSRGDARKVQLRLGRQG